MSLAGNVGWSSYPIRSGFFQELDRLAAAAADMADLLGDLLEHGPSDAWSASEALTIDDGEGAYREACRLIAAASGLASSSRMLDLLQAEKRVLRAVRRAATRIWPCEIDGPRVESQRAREGGLALAAVAGELRAAIRCLAASGRRPESLEHCREVRRLVGVARELSAPVGVPPPVDREAVRRRVAWEGALASMANVSAACLETAALIEIVVTEA